LAAKRFREDLLFRLEVVPITLPSLRERKEDIPLLVEHLIAKFNRSNPKQIRGMSGRSMAELLRYSWPGNIRELENVIEQAAVMSEGDILEITDLTSFLRSGGGSGVAEEVMAWPRSLKDAERELILKTLQNVQGNRTRAAELLRISLRGLHYKLREIHRERGAQGVEPEDSGAEEAVPDAEACAPQRSARPENSVARDKSSAQGKPSSLTEPPAPGR